MKIFHTPFVFILICYTPKKERIFEVNATCHRHRMTPKSPRGRLQPMTGVKEVAAVVQHGFLSYSLGDLLLWRRHAPLFLRSPNILCSWPWLVQKVGKGSSKQEEDKMKQIEESQADFDKLSQTLRLFLYKCISHPCSLTFKWVLLSIGSIWTQMHHLCRRQCFLGIQLQFRRENFEFEADPTTPFRRFLQT